MKSTRQQFLAAVVLIGALTSTFSPLLAQNSAGTAAGMKLSEAEELSPYRPWTLGIEAGSTGAGASVSWRFADHFGARAGFDAFEYSDGGYVIEDLTYDASIRLMSQPLTFDIYPWKAHSFHISVGVQFNQNRLTGTAVDGGAIIPPAVLGSLTLEIEQELVNPYLSIGGNFFYFDRAHHWALGGELGVAYTGEPKVSLTSSLSGPIIDAGLALEQAKIQEYANDFQWWPVLKLMVTYSF